jgi:hypothetical protein
VRGIVWRLQIYICANLQSQLVGLIFLLVRPKLHNAKIQVGGKFKDTLNGD